MNEKLKIYFSSLQKKYRGFTLIELLVVIAIISILVSILLPSLARAKDSAKSVICQSQLHSVSMGFEYYLDGYRDVYPFWDPQNPKIQLDFYNTFWTKAVALMLAPDLDTIENASVQLWLNAYYGRNGFPWAFCPKAQRSADASILSTYAWNNGPRPNDSLGDYDYWGSLYSMQWNDGSCYLQRRADVTQPSRTILINESYPGVYANESSVYHLGKSYMLMADGSIAVYKNYNK